MKRFLLLPLLALLVGCSADNEDLLVPETQIQALELQADPFSTTTETSTSTFCGAGSSTFGEYGDLEIKHDGFFVYLTITAREGYYLVDTKLHLASSDKPFPTVGNSDGNLPPGQMEHKFTVESGKSSFTFPALSFANDLEGNYISIASKTTFTDGTNTFSSWTGPEKGPKGDWFYLNYELKTCCELAYAGADKKLTITKALYDSNIRTSYWLRRVLLNDFLEPGVAKSGTFSPTPPYLQQMYNDWADGVIKPDDLDYDVTAEGHLILQTVYSLKGDGCSDEAVLTLYVLNPDNPNPPSS